MLPGNYLPVGIFALLSILFPLVTFFLTRFFRPDKFTLQRDTTYECGEISIGEAQIQFHFQYYMFALIFVVFDVVIAFLVLWAIIFSKLPILLNIPVLIFVLILTVGVFYALKKEAKIWI